MNFAFEIHLYWAVNVLHSLFLLLSKKAGGRRSATATKSASDLAETAIDRLADTSAPGHAQAGRTRRLLQGPKEFREMRVKVRKPKSAT